MNAKRQGQLFVPCASTIVIFKNNLTSTLFFSTVSKNWEKNIIIITWQVAHTFAFFSFVRMVRCWLASSYGPQVSQEVGKNCLSANAG